MLSLPRYFALDAFTAVNIPPFYFSTHIFELFTFLCFPDAGRESDAFE